jgi:hypothetical protein
VKSIKVTDLSAIRNELKRYKSGKKFDINQFNQVARLAWLGKVVMQPLDPQDPECKAYLLFADHPDALSGHFLNPDQDLVGAMHIVDGEQGEALAKIIEQGVHDRAALYQELAQRDFYFPHFFKPEDSDR